MKPLTYVLGTRSTSSDEYWAIGYYGGWKCHTVDQQKRHIILDRDGNIMGSAKGFAKVMEITDEVGEFFKEYAEQIDGNSKSVYTIAREIMAKK